jgi:hypothetical protein
MVLISHTERFLHVHRNVVCRRLNRRADFVRLVDQQVVRFLATRLYRFILAVTPCPPRPPMFLSCYVVPPLIFALQSRLNLDRRTIMLDALGEEA